MVFKLVFQLLKLLPLPLVQVLMLQLLLLLLLVLTLLLPLKLLKHKLTNQQRTLHHRKMATSRRMVAMSPPPATNQPSQTISRPMSLVTNPLMSPKANPATNRPMVMNQPVICQWKTGKGNQ